MIAETQCVVSVQSFSEFIAYPHTWFRDAKYCSKKNCQNA